ncbi:MAG: NYN domain-containing protein [Sedimentisphaerales bacterium]|nr:NYN domain-containing protein [Sedimentisphaerales bacterium]
MFVIDGHNLLWAVQGMASGPEEISDVGLCRAVGRYLKQRREAGEVVFDGTGPRDKSEFDKIDGVEVLFAGFGTDTDTIIEGKISANNAPKSLTVVSSDNRLRKAARARKANSLKSEEFWSELMKELGRKRVVDEPTGKRGGLSDAETEQWLDFFGIES